MSQMDVVHVLEESHGSTSMPWRCVINDEIALARFRNTIFRYTDHTQNFFCLFEEIDILINFITFAIRFNLILLKNVCLRLRTAFWFNRLQITCLLSVSSSPSHQPLTHC
jgi:hypothetical protein